MGYHLNQSTYLALLRTTFVLSVFFTANFYLLLLEDVGEGNLDLELLFIPLFFSVLTHQVVYAFKVPFLCDNLGDIIWIVLDILGLLTCAYMFNKERLPQNYLTHRSLSVVLISLYILLLFSRVYLYLRARKEAEKRPFNLRQMGGISILFGKSLWKARLIGETKRLILARGILASTLLAGIVAFFYVNVFIGAFQELVFTPTQSTRTADGVIPYPNLLHAGIWGVMFTIVVGDLSLGEDAAFMGLVNNATAVIEVMPLWRGSQLNNTLCNSEKNLSPSLTFTFDCPSIVTSHETSYFETMPESLRYYDGTYQPDLLITVDFNVMRISSNTTTDIALNSIQAMVKMTESPNDVLAMTRPTILIPGVNMVGMVSMEIHQTYKNPGVATLGIFENTQSTLIGQVTQLYPDSSTSPLIRRGTNISTLRLSVVRQTTQWNIIQDSKNNSFIGGFSKVGGLWTFLSGIFAAIFGSSLMRVLFGNKPISVFGFAHRWERDAIFKAYHASYPEIREEMSVPPEKRGMLHLIQDHIVDLNLIDKPDLDEPELESNELSVLHTGRLDSSTPLVAVPEA